MREPNAPLGSREPNAPYTIVLQMCYESRHGIVRSTNRWSNEDQLKRIVLSFVRLRSNLTPYSAVVFRRHAGVGTLRVFEALCNYLLIKLAALGTVDDQGDESAPPRAAPAVAPLRRRC